MCVKRNLTRESYPWLVIGKHSKKDEGSRRIQDSGRNWGTTYD